MANFEIQGADGNLYEVEAPDAQSAAAAFKKFEGGGAAESVPSADVPGARTGSGEAFKSGAMQGMTLGFGDEINAGLMTPIEMGIDLAQGKGIDIGRSFNQALEKNRNLDQVAQASDPNAALAGDVVGSLVTGGTMAKGGVTLMNAAKPTVASMATRGAIEGAGYGAVSGFGRADGDLNDRLQGAVESGAGGAVTGGVLGGVSGALASRGALKAVPSVDDLKARAGALYDAAEARGVTFPQPAVRTLADETAAVAMSEGLDPTLHPGATAALKRLQDAGATGMTVKDAQTMRRILSAAAKDPMNPDQARIAKIMVSKLDDFVGNAAPELAAARTVYSQAKRGERIEQAIELAGSRAGQFSGSGFENALRTEFRAIERQIIKGQIKGLSQEEIGAIKRVARGGPVENILRYVGKLAPTGVVSFMGAGGVPFAVGNAFGGPAAGALAAGATMGAGFAARAGATSMTAKNAAIAAALARSGGKMPAGVPPSVSNALMRSLIAAGGNESGNIRAALIGQTMGQGQFAPVR